MTPTVYVADGCPHCARLLEDLARRNVRFVLVNLSKDPARTVEVAAATRERRLPVLIDHERCSVGFVGASSSFAELGVRWAGPASDDGDSAILTREWGGPSRR